jgi:hypothetical protein
MELKDLIGLHKLSGVDMNSESIKDTWGDNYEDCQVIRFVLDKKTYSAIEDPEDGYRSCMREIREDSAKVENTFAPQAVFCNYVNKGDYSENADILEFQDVKTGKTLLRVGTDNTDDYYPQFICEWIPENMSINEKNNK